jgi:hypothetical protein
MPCYVHGYVHTYVRTVLIGTKTVSNDFTDKFEAAKLLLLQCRSSHDVSVLGIANEIVLSHAAIYYFTVARMCTMTSKKTLNTLRKFFYGHDI